MRSWGHAPLSEGMKTNYNARELHLPLTTEAGVGLPILGVH